MSEIQRPVILVLAVTLGVCLVAAVLLVFAPVAPGGTSAAVVSASNGFISDLPFIAAMLAGGFVLVAMGSRRS